MRRLEMHGYLESPANVVIHHFNVCLENGQGTLGLTTGLIYRYIAESGVLLPKFLKDEHQLLPQITHPSEYSR